MDLRHARLVHADDVPHFFHGQLFVIVESNHQTFSLRKTFDTPRQECDQLSSFEKIVRIFCLRIAHERIDTAEPFDLLRTGFRDADFIDHFSKPLRRQRELRRQLVFARGAAETRFESSGSGVELAAATPHRAWQPVETAETVEDRAFDAKLRVRPKTNTLVGVEFVSRINKAEETCLGQIGQLYLSGQSPRDVERYPPYQRQAMADIGFLLRVHSVFRKNGCFHNCKKTAS